MYKETELTQKAQLKFILQIYYYYYYYYYYYGISGDICTFNFRPVLSNDLLPGIRV
jgi:hypothetical protein